MTASWLSYVPYHVAEDILLHPSQDPVGREKRFDAVALFADVDIERHNMNAIAGDGLGG